jgi:hypothetical protein
MVPGLSFIHPGFVNAAAVRGILTGNLVFLPTATAMFILIRGGAETPSSMKAK